MTGQIVFARRTNKEVCDALGLDPINIQSVTIDLSRRPARVHIAGLSVEIGQMVAFEEGSYALIASDPTGDDFYVGVSVCRALGLDPTKVHGLKVILSHQAPRFEMVNYIDTAMGADLAKFLAGCLLTKVDAA